MQKTLLLTSCLPGEENVGQLLVNRMLQEVPDLPIAIACVTSSSFPEKKMWNSELEISGEIHEHATPVTRRRLPQLLIAAKRAARRSEFRRQADLIADFAVKTKCEQVWSILGSLNLVEVTEHVSNRLRGPLITQVWDDVEHLARQRSFHGVALRGLRRRFGRCLNKSVRTGVIGETMAGSYATQYEANPVIVRLGVPEFRASKTDANNEGEYTITFSGGMYCYSAFCKLLEALDLCGWQCDRKRIRLRVFSNEARIHSRSASNIEFLGWRDTTEIADALHNSDLLYLPQPFESENYALAHLSFPTKTSDYVATGVPIFIHAPKYASLSLLRQSYEGLQICNSLDPKMISTHIVEMLSNDETRCSATLASKEIASRMLTQDRFRDGVRTLLGLSVNEGFASNTLSGLPTVA